MQQKMEKVIIDKLPGVVQNPVQDKTKYAAVQGLFAGLQKEAVNPAAIAKGFSKGWKGLKGLVGYGDEAADVATAAPARGFWDELRNENQVGMQLLDAQEQAAARSPQLANTYAETQKAFELGVPVQATARTFKDPAYATPKAEKARAYRAANPGKKFYEDISDEALDTTITGSPNANSFVHMNPGDRAAAQPTQFHYGHPSQGLDPAEAFLHRQAPEHEVVHNLQVENAVDEFDEWERVVLASEPKELGTTVPYRPPAHSVSPEFADPKLKYVGHDSDIAYLGQPIEQEAAASDLAKWWWDRTGGANGGEIIETPEQIRKALKAFTDEGPATHFYRPGPATQQNRALVPPGRAKQWGLPGTWFDKYRAQAPGMQQKMEKVIIDKLPGVVQNPMQNKIKMAAVQGLFAGMQKEAVNPAAVTRGLSKGLKGLKNLIGYSDEAVDAAKAVNKTPTPRTRNTTIGSDVDTLNPASAFPDTVEEGLEGASMVHESLLDVGASAPHYGPGVTWPYAHTQDAMQGGHQFESTARELKNPAYVGPAAESARAHRAANPGKKFYEDISDEALDTTLTVHPSVMSAMPLAAENVTTPGRAGVRQTDLFYGHENYNPQIGKGSTSAMGAGAPEMHYRAGSTHEPTHNLQTPLPEEIVEGQLLGRFADNPDYANFNAAAGTGMDIAPDALHKQLKSNWTMMKALNAVPEGMAFDDFAQGTLEGLQAQNRVGTNYAANPIEIEAAGADLRKWWWDRTGGANGGEILETPEQIRKALDSLLKEQPATHFMNPADAEFKQMSPGTWFDMFRNQSPEMQQKMREEIIDKLPGIVQNPVQDKTKYAAVQGLFAGMQKKARSQTIGAGLLTLAKKEELARRYNELYSEDIKNILKTEIPGTKGIHLPFMNEKRIDQLSGALAHPETATQLMIPFSELHMPLAHYAKGKMPELKEDEETETEDSETEKAAKDARAPGQLAAAIPGGRSYERVRNLIEGRPINWGAYLNPLYAHGSALGAAFGAVVNAPNTYRYSQPPSKAELRESQERVNTIKATKKLGPPPAGTIFRSGGFGATPEEPMEKTNSVKTAAVLGLFAGLEKRALIALHAPKLWRGAKKVMNVVGRDDVGAAMSLGYPAAFGSEGITPGGGALEGQYLTNVGGRAANRVAGATSLNFSPTNNRLLRNHYNPSTQKVHQKVVKNTTRRLGNKIGGRVGGAIASKIPLGAAGVGAGLLATPFNALMEGADAAGALPKWLGGTGWGNAGWSDSNEFRQHTTPGFGANARIMGFKDPTGGVLDYAGSALNSWAKPVRTVANIAEGAYKLPQELYGAATSGPSAEAVQQSENYMKKLEADGVSSRWAVGQMPGQGRRPADDPLTKRDTLYQQAIAQGMDRNAAQDHAIAGAAGFPVEGMAGYNYGLEQGMTQAESIAGAKRLVVLMQQRQQQRQQQQQQQAAQGGEVASPGTHPGGMSGFAKQFPQPQTQQSPPQQVAQTQQR